MVKKLFLIDCDDLRRNLFEEVFKQQVYTLPSFEDASFRIPDFEPDLILLSTEVALGLNDDQKKFLNDSEIPVGVILKEAEKEGFISNGWKGPFLVTPLNLSELKTQVESLIS